MKFYGDNEHKIPYATLDELAKFSSKDIADYEAKFGEATFDEVVQLTIIREKIFANLP